MLKAEGYKPSRTARIKLFKTFSAFTTFGSIQLFFRKACGYPINQHCHFISQLGCPKFCMIAHGLSLKAFSLQPSVYLA
jgi:hypothetical protein